MTPIFFGKYLEVFFDPHKTMSMNSGGVLWLLKAPLPLKILLQCRSIDELLTVGELQHQFPKPGGKSGRCYHRVAAKPDRDGGDDRSRILRSFKK